MLNRLFTAVEANRTLPLVRRIVEDILEAGRELRDLAVERGRDADARMEELQGSLREYFHELEQIGCTYKDWGFEMGLVDFPGVIDEEPVLLCWRTDEPRVGWYHKADEGYAGRAPIPPELLEETDDCHQPEAGATQPGSPH